MGAAAGAPATRPGLKLNDGGAMGKVGAPPAAPLPVPPKAGKAAGVGAATTG